MKIISCIWRGVLLDSVGDIISSSFIPPLNSHLYKGQMGRVGIIGGSADYTGAPYYSGEAALRFGADLSSIFCALEASLPIKSYSPELMVSPFYSYEDGIRRSEILFNTEPLLNGLSRMHSYVIGPGLGRDLKVSTEVNCILQQLVDANKQ